MKHPISFSEYVVQKGHYFRDLENYKFGERLVKLLKSTFSSLHIYYTPPCYPRGSIIEVGNNLV